MVAGNQPTSDHRNTATHEAGHAVVGRVLMLKCGGASIQADHESVAEREKRGKVRVDFAVWHGRIITYMAGAESEVALLGSTLGGDGDDRRQIDLMSEELTNSDEKWERIEPRLRAMTRQLVRRHRGLIVRVAEELLAKGKLTGRQLDKLVGRSVDDVKVNAPWILAMHRSKYG
jgi:hypothetical protein